jgi:hypothetical protein
MTFSSSAGASELKRQPKKSYALAFMAKDKPVAAPVAAPAPTATPSPPPATAVAAAKDVAAAGTGAAVATKDEKKQKSQNSPAAARLRVNHHGAASSATNGAAAAGVAAVKAALADAKISAAAAPAVGASTAAVPTTSATPLPTSILNEAPAPGPLPLPTSAVQHVFYSWQSDLPGQQVYLRLHLQSAVDEINARSGSVRLQLDEATRDEQGSPNITEVIFRKIDRCSVFVADVSTINEKAPNGQRKTPNPNVLIELGYAIKTVGWERVILLFNSSSSKPDKDLPFDIKAHRVSPFHFQPNSKKGARRMLQNQLISASKIGNFNEDEQAAITGLLHQLQWDSSTSADVALELDLVFRDGLRDWLLQILRDRPLFPELVNDLRRRLEKFSSDMQQMEAITSNMQAIAQEVAEMPEEQALRQMALTFLQGAANDREYVPDREYGCACDFLYLWIKHAQLAVGLRLRKVNLVHQDIFDYFFQGSATSSSSEAPRPYIFRMVEALAVACQSNVELHNRLVEDDVPLDESRLSYVTFGQFLRLIRWYNYAVHNIWAPFLRLEDMSIHFNKTTYHGSRWFDYR